MRSRFGAIAQLVERLLCKQEVRGSIPRGSTEIPQYPPSSGSPAGGFVFSGYRGTTGSSAPRRALPGPELLTARRGRAGLRIRSRGTQGLGSGYEAQTRNKAPVRDEGLGW